MKWAGDENALFKGDGETVKWDRVCGGEALKGCGTALEGDQEALNKNGNTLSGDGAALTCDG